MRVAKRKELHQKERDIKERKKQENIALALKGLNCKGRKEEPGNDNSGDSEMQCGFCLEVFDLAVVLRHIARTEACKIFYGPRFEEMKREHRRQRKEFQRKENGTKKELDQQRQRYATNPEVRQRKNDYYEEDKKKQEIFQQEQDKKRNKEDATTLVTRCEDESKRKNEQGYKQFKWVIDFIQHLFETFKDVCEGTRNYLIKLIESIEENYSNMSLKMKQLQKMQKKGYFNMMVTNIPTISKLKSISKGKVFM